jgi:hypothetical protein
MSINNPDNPGGVSLSRRRFLTLGATAGLGGFILAACSGKNDAVPSQRPPAAQPNAVPAAATPVLPEINFSSSLLNEIGKEGKVVAETTITQYIQAYGYPNPSLKLSTTSLASISEPGESTLEVADSGSIEYDIAAMKKGLDATGFLQYFRNITLHAMTHASKIPGNMPFDHDIMLPDGVIAYAFEGLSILVKLPDGTLTGFRFIEEATSDALSLPIDRNYRMSYPRIGSLVSFLTENFFSAQNLASMLQQHQGLNFISLVTNRPIGDPQDLIIVKDWFTQVQSNPQGLEIVKQEIIDYRSQSQVIPAQPQQAYPGPYPYSPTQP